MAKLQIQARLRTTHTHPCFMYKQGCKALSGLGVCQFDDLAKLFFAQTWLVRKLLIFFFKLANETSQTGFTLKH